MGTHTRRGRGCGACLQPQSALPCLPETHGFVSTCLVSVVRRGRPEPLPNAPSHPPGLHGLSSVPIPKGEGCRGCPWEHKGKWMVPDEIRPNAKVLILGQNPGAHEEAGERLIERAGKVKRWEPCKPAPFLGDSGYDLEHTFLPLAGLDRQDVSLGNVVRCRVGGSNKLPDLGRVETRLAIQHCQHAYGRSQTPRHVVALGEYALWATTGESGGHPPP